MILDAVGSAQSCYPSEKTELERRERIPSHFHTYNTDPHTHTHIHSQPYKSFHTVKTEFSVTNNIIMRSDKNGKREKFYMCVSTKAQSV